MIIPSMTFKQMYDGLVEDSEKLKYKMNYLAPKVNKIFAKSTTFPTWEKYDYTIPATQNHHIIFFYAPNCYEFKSTTFCVLFDKKQRFIIRGMSMGYQHIPNGPSIQLPQIHAYTSHFLQRYNERFLKNPSLSPNEIAGIFLARNEKPMPIKINENINKNYKEHGIHSDQGFRVKDGFCFTQTTLEGEEDKYGNRENDRVDAMIVIYTTFLNEYDMSETQRKAINKEHIETIQRSLEVLDFLQHNK